MAAVTSAVILEPPKIKFATVSTVSPSISQEVMGPIVGRENKLHQFALLSGFFKLKHFFTQEGSFPLSIRLTSVCSAVKVTVTLRSSES